MGKGATATSTCQLFDNPHLDPHGRKVEIHPSPGLATPFVCSSVHLFVHSFFSSFSHVHCNGCNPHFPRPSRITKRPMSRVLTQSGLLPFRYFFFVLLLTCAQYYCPIHGASMSLCL